MRGNVIETVMGAVVLVVAALFLFFAYSTSQLRSVPGYPLTANFEHIDGIRDGSDVRISGIKVGSVLSATLDPKTFLATVTMSVEPNIKLPDDSVAEIVSSGLLGDKYMSLVPGGSDKDIPAGGQIKYTQSSVSLEHLIGQMMFSPPGGKKPGEGDPAGAAGKALAGEPPAPAPANSDRAAPMAKNRDRRLPGLAYARGRAGLVCREDQGAQREPVRAARSCSGRARGRGADGLRRGPAARGSRRDHRGSRQSVPQMSPGRCWRRPSGWRQLGAAVGDDLRADRDAAGARQDFRAGVADRMRARSKHGHGDISARCRSRCVRPQGAEPAGGAARITPAFLQHLRRRRPARTPSGCSAAGWFSSSLALSELEHPVYDVTLLGCKAPSAAATCAPAAPSPTPSPRGKTQR